MSDEIDIDLKIEGARNEKDIEFALSKIVAGLLLSGQEEFGMSSRDSRNMITRIAMRYVGKWLNTHPCACGSPDCEGKAMMATIDVGASQTVTAKFSLDTEQVAQPKVESASVH